MGKTKNIECTILAGFKYLSASDVDELKDRIPNEQSDEYYRKIVFNENAMPVLLKLWNFSFVADSDQAKGILMEIKDGLSDYLPSLESGNWSEYNDLEIVDWLNYRLNGYATVSEFKSKGLKEILTNQITPYAFGENGIELLSNLQTNEFSQMGNE